MKTILKYTLTNGRNSFSMPKGAVVLSVQEQNNMACLWALVEMSGEIEIRTFETVGTGWEMDNRDRKYLGTLQLAGGTFVWHVFEVLK